MDDFDEGHPMSPSKSYPIDERAVVLFLLAALVPAALHAALAALARRRRQPPPPPSPPRPRRPHSATPSTPRYGLSLGEAVSDDESDAEDDLTARELRRLQQSPQFHAWCRSRGLRAGDLEGIDSRQRLYRRLRDIDPPLFWQLCRPETLSGRETQDLGPLGAAGEYLVSAALSLAAAGALGWCAWHGAGPAAWAAAVAATWTLCFRNWAAGRPVSGPLCCAWYEDPEWGHRAPAARAVLAGLAETIYLVGSAGSGAAVSLAMRVRAGQSVGEKIAGVRVVTERRVRLDNGGGWGRRRGRPRPK